MKHNFDKKRGLTVKKLILTIILCTALFWANSVFAAGNIKRTFGSATQIEGTGDGYTTLSGTTEEFSADVDLETNGYEGAHVIVEINYDASPTDEVDIAIYGSLDGSNYDDTAIFKMQGDHDTDPQQISIIVKDVLHFRVSFQQTGSTNSHDVRAYQQSWRWYYE